MTPSQPRGAYGDGGSTCGGGARNRGQSEPPVPAPVRMTPRRTRDIHTCSEDCCRQSMVSTPRRSSSCVVKTAIRQGWSPGAQESRSLSSEFHGTRVRVAIPETADRRLLRGRPARLRGAAELNSERAPARSVSRETPNHPAVDRRPADSTAHGCSSLNDYLSRRFHVKQLGQRRSASGCFASCIE